MLDYKAQYHRRRDSDYFSFFVHFGKMETGANPNFSVKENICLASDIHISTILSMVTLYHVDLYSIGLLVINIGNV